MTIQSNLVDIQNRRIYPAEIKVENGIILSIAEIKSVPHDAGYIMPGFVDAHIHIESSMLPPSEFARMAVVHGTLGTVSDPHEIANVMGEEGVKYMIEDGKKVPFKFCFGAPSCVPATEFETAGAKLDASSVKKLLDSDDIGYLSEVMNFPGVINEDADLLQKIEHARKIGKPVDGHAPGLRGADCIQYFKKGITTDHECFTLEEAIEKAKLGVKILIREGSAAKNFDALHPIIGKYPRSVMFCSDDKHPDDLIEGHINLLVKKSIDLGYELFDVLYAACIHPVLHYNLNLGLLRVGDSADFIIVKDLKSFDVSDSYINGNKVAENGASLLHRTNAEVLNHFNAQKIQEHDLIVKSLEDSIPVIKAIDGEIITERHEWSPIANYGTIESDITSDVLKIVVVNRYSSNTKLCMGFITGFGLQKGAIASSVAHDSHNIVAVGVDDDSLVLAINSVIDSKGGISATNGEGDLKHLALPIAGLMSCLTGHELAESYFQIDLWVKNEMKCKLRAPYMTLSFMALPVIPSLKITDLGLFDVEKFKFV